MQLTVRPSTKADQDAAWALYGPFIKTHVFKNATWNENAERDRFFVTWKPDTHCVIEIDDKSVGWMSLEQSDEAVQIENMFILDEWRGKGVCTTIIEQMVPKWREGGRRVQTSVLKGSDQSGRVLQFMSRLGFEANHEDQLCSIMHYR